MTSFSSFLRTNKYPTPHTICTLLEGPLTSLSLFLYALLTTIIIVVYLLIIQINNTALVTVPAHGGTIKVGIIGTPQSLDPLLAIDQSDTAITQLLHGTTIESAGPYKLKSIVKKKGVIQEIKLRRNKAYKEQPVYSDEIHFVVFPNQLALITALSNGSIDATSALSSDTPLPPALLNDYTVTAIPTNQTLTLYRHSTESLLNNPSFVSIIDEFIDKKSLIAIVENGYGTLARDIDGTPLPIEDTVAKLEKAGFTYNNGSLARGGTPVGFSLAVENDTHTLAAAQELARELGGVGIIVSIKAFDQGTFQNGVSASEYSSILATHSDITIPSTYKTVLDLYTRTQPLVIHTSIQGATPSSEMTAAAHFASIPSWYSENEKLWKWVVPKEQRLSVQE